MLVPLQTIQEAFGHGRAAASGQNPKSLAGAVLFRGAKA